MPTSFTSSPGTEPGAETVVKQALNQGPPKKEQRLPQDHRVSLGSYIKFLTPLRPPKMLSVGPELQNLREKKLASGHHLSKGWGLHTWQEHTPWGQHVAWGGG